MSKSPIDKEVIFDKFISDFDRTLNKDTSTLATITTRSRPGSPLEGARGACGGGGTGGGTTQAGEPTQAGASGAPSTHAPPSIVTPTKHRSEPLALGEDHPLNQLDDELAAFSTAPASTTTRRPKPAGPSSASTSTPKKSGLTRSMTMGSVAVRKYSTGSTGSTPKVGLNLNLPINKKPLKAPPNRHSFNEPSTTPGEFAAAHRRTRSNSTASVASSVVSTPKTNANTTLDPTDDINESLRLLALKETKILELKDELKLLQQRIHYEELDLKKLKQQVQKNLYRDLSPNNSHANTTLSSVSTSTTSTPILNKTGDALIDTTTSFKSKDAPQHREKHLKPQSVWSKPINLFNQFDQMIQNEFEKISKFDYDEEGDETSAKEIKNLFDNQKSVTEEVTSSLWSFVSDVKQNLLGDELPQPHSSDTVATIAEEGEEDLKEMKDMNGLDK